MYSILGMLHMFLSSGHKYKMHCKKILLVILHQHFFLFSQMALSI